MVVGLNSILYLLCFVFGVDHNCYIWESQVSHLITTISWAAHGSIKSNTTKEQPKWKKTQVFVLTRKEVFYIFWTNCSKIFHDMLTLIKIVIRK